ncbi:hypothetical protein [Halpernia sp.]|uniref:hypothetical protein n=1 Tax=Halpernia sp. TaxID=2782209 RepID=UPI003A8D7952
MEKTNRLLIPFFIFVIIISLLGFYKTYLSFFPNFNHFEKVIHIHFAAFILWFVLIILQPILIRQRKYALQRKIGKLSYFLVPILVVTILILVTQKTQRELSAGQTDAYVTAFIGLLDAVFLSIYYCIAMYYRRNIRWHVAFLIGATLIILNPGMSRLLNQIKPGLGLLTSVIMPFLIPILILIFEKIKFKRKIWGSPYLYFLMFWTFEIILLVTVPNTIIWKNIVNYIMKIV